MSESERTASVRERTTSVQGASPPGSRRQPGGRAVTLRQLCRLLRENHGIAIEPDTLYKRLLHRRYPPPIRWVKRRCPVPVTRTVVLVPESELAPLAEWLRQHPVQGATDDAEGMVG